MIGGTDHTMKTMQAQTHTWRMLSWWAGVGIKWVDLLVRRPTGVTVPHQEQSIHDLPISWLKAENTHGAEIYIRPGRNQKWPLVFLDDVEIGKACRIAQKYAALVVHTSSVGGCHLWIKTSRALDEYERGQAQRWLAPRANADRASTSGEHLGRLAGMRNWKRHGAWVNVIQPQWNAHCGWNPSPAIQAVENHQENHCFRSEDPNSTRNSGFSDQSESGKEWGWVRGMLEHGVDPETAFQHLLQRARIRRGPDAERYARLTIQRALNREL